MRGLRRGARGLLALLSVCGVLLAEPALAQNRVALVIGNNAYLRVAPLGNAVNDASTVADELNKLGFQVIRVLDSKLAEFNQAQQLYLKAVANGGIGIVYYAGHGVQVEGRSYLLPVDFAAGKASELPQTAISLPNLLDAVDAAKARLSIVILDACRDNPFPAELQAQTGRTRGLSEVARPMPSGTLVLYAASSNQTALDAVPGQRTKNGLFTGEFLSLLKEPGLEIRDLAQKVRFNVMEKARAAGHQQVPALYDNLSFGSFYIAQPPAPQASAASGPLPAKIRIIVPFAPKGPSNSVLRSLVPFLAKELGREITVENEIDVEGDKVTAALAAAPADGSVLMVSSFTPSARRFETNDQRAAPLGIFADTPLSVFVHAKHGVKSLSELLAATRASRTKLRMTVPPRGAPLMCGQQLQRAFGADAVELVRVNADAAAVAEVANGNADITCSSAAATRPGAAQPNSQLREIAEIRMTASPAARKIQVEAAGSQGFNIVAPNWLGLFAPNGINPQAARQLSAAIAKVQADPAYAQSIARLSALPVSADQATPDGLLRVLRLTLALQRN